MNFANLIIGKDQFFILADRNILPLFQGKISSDHLLEARIGDIWIRDFAPVIPSKQIKFEYLPSYNRHSISKDIDRSFQNWFEKFGLEYQMKSNIIIDGENVVDNPSTTRVILTDRIFQDNPSLNGNQMQKIF